MYLNLVFFCGVIDIKIKVKNISKNGIKLLKKEVVLVDKLKDNVVEIKNKSNELVVKDDCNITGYANNKVNEFTKLSTEKNLKRINGIGRKSFRNTKKNFIKLKNKISKNKSNKRNKTNIKIKSSNNNLNNVQTMNEIVKRDSQNKALNFLKRKLRNSIVIVKKSVRATFVIIKNTITGMKAVVELLIAGGWVIVIIIIIVCIVGILCTSSFGILFSNEQDDDSLKISTIIVEINNDLSSKVEEIKRNNIYNNCNINTSISNWKEILAFYSVYAISNNKDSITLDKDKVSDIKRIFWEFNTINYRVDLNKVLYIDINSKSLEKMMNNYNFSLDQKEEVNNLLNSELDSMWNGIIYNSTNNNKWIFPVSDFYVITTYYSQEHQALDIASSYNTNIHSIADGIVILVKDGCVAGNLSCNGKAGNYITIKHDGGYYSQYMHLNKIMVNVGDKVSGGDVIGKMGNTGNVIPVPTDSSSTLGTHLHFVLWIGNPGNGGKRISLLSFIIVN